MASAVVEEPHDNGEGGEYTDEDVKDFLGEWVAEETIDDKASGTEQENDHEADARDEAAD